MPNDDLIVIYDPDKEIAAIVDTNNRVGFGPAYIGPQAAGALEAFMLTVPYDMTEVSPYVLRDWFEQYAQSQFPPSATTGGEADTGAVVAGGSTGVADAALAEHTAIASAGEPPGAQPADTDMGAHASASPTVASDNGGTLPEDTGPANQAAQYDGPCPACSGTGSVPGGEPDSQVMCNLCKGSGHFTATASA